MLTSFYLIAGETHPLIATSVLEQGIVLQLVGSYASASSQLEQCLTMCQLLFGESHPFTMQCMSVIGHLLTLQGRCHEANKVCR